jgi:hypothetical protein
MATLTKAEKKQDQRHIPGKGGAQYLISWLNGTSLGKTSMRLEIISLIEAANRLLRDIPAKAEDYARRKRKPAIWPDPGGKEGYPSKAATGWYWQQLSLNLKLREYKFYPVLEIPLGDAWKVGWKVEQDMKARRRVREARPGGLFREYLTPDPKAVLSRLVFLVIRLAEIGCLYRVRPCRNCSTWFYAERRTQHFCTPKCWKSFHYRQENTKVKRRAYMKDYMAARRKKLKKKLKSRRRGE